VGAYTGHLAYAQNRAVGGAESRDLLAGLSAEFGPHRVLGSVLQHNDRSKANQDARQFGVAYMYALSKRTDLYTAYGHINNKNGADFKVGNATDDGNTPTAFNLGMRHLF
jgi:predicted porin